MLDCSSIRDIDNQSTKKDQELIYHCKKIVALHAMLVKLIFYLLFHQELHARKNLSERVLDVNEALYQTTEEHTHARCI
jgi:hypothetical protein